MRFLAALPHARALAVTGLLVAGGVGAAEPPEPAPDFRPMELPGGGTTVNDRCPVRKRPLNSRLEPLWVNGRPVGFC